MVEQSRRSRPTLPGSGGNHLPSRGQRWLLRAVLAVGALGGAVCAANMVGDWIGHPPTNLTNAVTAIALVTALGLVVRRIEGRSRPIWVLLFFAQLLSSLAVVTLELLEAIGPWSPVPGWAYTMHLLAHPLQIIAVLLLVRQRGQGDRAAWLDAALMTLTIYAVVWGFVLEPVTSSAAAGELAKFLGPFPIWAGIAVVAVMLRIVLITGRDCALLLLLAAAVVTAAADVGNNEAARTIPDQHRAWVTALWIAGSTFTLAAVLHPRATLIGNEQPPDAGGLGTVRIVALATGALLIPSLLLWAILFDETRKLGTWAWMSVAAMALVLIRLWLVVQALQTQTRSLAVQARTDSLTGLANRRTWEYQVARAATSTIDGPPTTRVLAMADLDSFKAFNDSYGHRSGDEMLRQCAAAWRETLGPATFLARYGGEEFALTMLADSTDDANDRLNAFRRSTPVPMTVSVGATEWPPGESAESVVERADLALYAAKNLGRDRVEWLPAVRPVAVHSE